MVPLWPTASGPQLGRPEGRVAARLGAGIIQRLGTPCLGDRKPGTGRGPWVAWLLTAWRSGTDTVQAEMAVSPRPALPFVTSCAFMWPTPRGDHPGGVLVHATPARRCYHPRPASSPERLERRNCFPLSLGVSSGAVQHWVVSQKRTPSVRRQESGWQAETSCGREHVVSVVQWTQEMGQTGSPIASGLLPAQAHPAGAVCARLETTWTELRTSLGCADLGRGCWAIKETWGYVSRLDVSSPTARKEGSRRLWWGWRG